MGGDEDCHERIDTLEEDFEALAKQALSAVGDLREKVDELEETVRERDEEIDELQAEVESLRERTDLLQQVRQAGNLKPETRAAILIQNLFNDAHANKDAGLNPKSQMDKNEAKRALGGGIQRQKIYPTFRKAEELVGDTDVLEYKQMPRSADENSYLELDLRNGDVPAVVAGHSIEKGGAIAGD